MKKSNKTNTLELNICDFIDLKWALKYDIKGFEDAGMVDTANSRKPLLEKLEKLIELDRESSEPLRLKLSKPVY